MLIKNGSEKIRTYSELVTFLSFDERFNYLKLNGVVGEETFGRDRYLNQFFYSNVRWKRDTRNNIIVRDEGCDLGIPYFDINGRIYVHHMNPITIEGLKIHGSEYYMDPEFLISTSLDTHNAIHYGMSSVPNVAFVERKPNDTCLWRK